MNKKNATLFALAGTILLFGVGIIAHEIINLVVATGHTMPLVIMLAIAAVLVFTFLYAVYSEDEG